MDVIVSGLTDDTMKNVLTLTSSLHSVKAKSHVYEHSLPIIHIDIRKYLFSERVVAPWNNFLGTNEHFRNISSCEHLVDNWFVHVRLTRYQI